jgi:putative ABC transport system permease protein
MDWQTEVRRILAHHPNVRALPAADLADITEEWTQHAEAAWVAARADGLSDAEAFARVRAQIEAWSVRLASTPRRRKHAVVVEPPPASTPGAAGVWQDLRYGARLLRKQPGFALLAVLTTALAIGATTTLFSVADGVLARPLPFADADRLVRLSETREGATRQLPSLITQVTYQTWREQPTSIEGIAGFRLNTVTMGGQAGDRAERITGAQVTASLFSVLLGAPE